MSEGAAVERVLKGKVVIAGEARGEAVVSSEPISFWGGIDPRTGEVIDRRHECSGQNVKGKVFVFPTGRGSSTASAILLEAVRTGAAPAAIINLKVDPILAIGSIVADEMYKKTCDAFIEASKEVIVADPLNPKVADESMVMGPVISAKSKSID